MTHTRTTAPVAFLLFAVATIAFSPGSARSATISVVPSDTTVTVGDDLCLRVTIDAFPNLEGAQLIYGFDPAKLGLLSASAGDVIAGAPGGYVDFLIPDVTAPTDSVWYEAAILTGSAAGPGILVFVCFTATTEGDAMLTCRRLDVRDSLNQQTLVPCSNAVIHIVGPTAARNRTWGGLKTIYR